MFNTNIKQRREYEKITRIISSRYCFCATSASAYDLTHPFYGPSAGGVTSTTSYDYSFKKLAKISDGNVEESSSALSEELAYGVTNDWTFYGSISRTWNKDEIKPLGIPASLTFKNKTTSWYLGTSYNFINDGKTFLQGSAYYIQDQTERPNDVEKSYSFWGTYGYNMECMTPYISVAYNNTLNKGSDNDPRWYAYAGAYKKLNTKTGVEAGLNYLHDTSSDTKFKELALSGKVSYLLTDNVAVDLNGAWNIWSTGKPGYDVKSFRGYTLGADLKIAF